ncbi:MAG: hypothetical protein KKE73_02565 [Proteobacteria bacterium]|nr:hypothetical protein [Pseudomonadota bacterium]
MRYTLLLLPLCVILLTGFSTIAAAPGPEAAMQTSGVTSMTASAPTQTSGQASAQGLSGDAVRSHSVRMKVVPTTYARPYKQSRQLKPVVVAPNQRTQRLSLHRQGISRNDLRASLSVKNPRPQVSRCAMRTPLSLERSVADHSRVASLAAQRLLSLAQRDLTSSGLSAVLTV